MPRHGWFVTLVLVNTIALLTAVSLGMLIFADRWAVSAYVSLRASQRFYLAEYSGGDTTVTVWPSTRPYVPGYFSLQWIKDRGPRAAIIPARHRTLDFFSHFDGCERPPYSMYQPPLAKWIIHIGPHDLQRHGWLLLCVCVLLVLYVARQFSRWLADRAKARQGLCHKCGYDLRAHKPGQRCPECGTAIPIGTQCGNV